MSQPVTIALLGVYAALFGAAVADSVRARRFGWLAAIVFFPGLGALFWLARRLSDARRR